jgi:hypothetical protein
MPAGGRSSVTRLGLETVKKAILLIMIVFLATAGLVVLRPFVWLRDFHGHIKRDGHPVPDSRVFRSSKGEVYVVLDSPYDRGYVIQPWDGVVGIPGRDFLVNTRLFLVSRESPLMLVDLRSPKTNNREPKLQVEERSAQFIDYDGHPLRVAW